MLTMSKTNFSQIDTKSFVLANQLVIEKPLFSALGNIRGARILDVGCGSGYYSKQFARKGAHVAGIDMNPLNVGTAKKYENKNLKFFVADAARFKLREKFDIVTAIFSLNELSKIIFKKTIANISLSLKKNGRLIFVIPHPHFSFMEKTDLIMRMGLNQRDYLNDGKKYGTKISLSNGGTITVTDHHYSLGFIFNVLMRNSFIINMFQELKVPKRKHRDYSTFPFYLLIAARKI